MSILIKTIIDILLWPNQNPAFNYVENRSVQKERSMKQADGRIFASFPSSCEGEEEWQVTTHNFCSRVHLPSP